jgi:hypothetical protein
MRGVGMSAGRVAGVVWARDRTMPGKCGAGSECLGHRVTLLGTDAASPEAEQPATASELPGLGLS